MVIRYLIYNQVSYLFIENNDCYELHFLNTIFRIKYSNSIKNEDILLDELLKKIINDSNINLSENTNYMKKNKPNNFKNNNYYQKKIKKNNYIYERDGRKRLRRF